MPDNWSIRAQLVALMLGIILPLAVLAGYSIHAEYRVSSARAEEHTRNMAEVTAATLRQFLVDAEGTLADLSRAAPIRAIDPAACNPFLQPLEIFLPQYANIVVTDLSAEIVCSSLPDGGEAPPGAVDADWFQEVVSSGRISIGKPRIGPVSGRWISVLAHPVRDADDVMVGVVALSLDLVRFQNLLVTPDLPPEAVITIDDRDGMVVARSSDPEAWVGRRLPPSNVPTDVLHGARGVTRTEGAEGIDRLWAFAQIPETSWRVWVGLPTASVYAPVRAAAIRNAAFVFIAFLLVGILAYLFHRRILGALGGLIEVARRAAEGEADSMPVDGPAEVVQVAWHFNRTLSDRRRAEEERRRSMERVRRAEARYRSIMENAVFGIYVSTPEGLFLEVNPALADMLGYASVEELRAVPVASVYRVPEHRAELITQHADGPTIRVAEVEWLRKDGTPLFVRLNGRIERQDGRMAYEVIVEDVTERRQLEEQLRHSQKMEAVGRIAGGVAHDFNNLLTVITAESDLLLEELGADDAHRNGVLEVRRAADRATALTRQLLTFSRKSVLQPAVLDVNRIVREMEGMLARLAGNSAEIRQSLAPDLRSVRADPGQLQQVLMNLVLNARDAGGSGGTIEIRTTNVVLDEARAASKVEVEPGAYVAISVRDEGPGVPPEIRSRIFEPFFTTKPEGAGTGLGLATVYGIASQSGGHVDFESAPTRGSVFTVYLPAADAHQQPPAADEPPPVRESAGEAAATILVTEDEDAVRRVVARILRARGYRVLEAPDGETALEAVRDFRGPIHLLLTDVVMPGMQGPALAERVLRVRPHTPVILMSGHTENREVHRVGTHGSVPFLPKPFTADELLRAVSTALRKRLREPAAR